MEQEKNQNVETEEKKENQAENNVSEKEEKKKNNKKLRMILVLIFIAIFAIISAIFYRGSFLEYKELGENYINIFFTNIKYQYAIIGINFVLLYFIIYMTNRGIIKGLKVFFEKEKIEVPKLPNKSLALVLSIIVSVIIGNILTDKIILALSNTTFGMNDPIFNLDISYFMFQKPIIEILIIYFISVVVGLSIYMALYYIITFNKYFDGIDGKMLTQSNLIKKLKRNIILVAIGVAAFTIVGTQNILFGTILKVNDEISITGAGSTEATIKLWGYIIFALVIMISIYRAVKKFEIGNVKGLIKNLIIIPLYLVIFFIVMIVYDLIFVNSNELDKEKQYLEYNIENTKNAYNISIDEENLEYSGMISQDEISKNENIINNIPIINKNVVLKTLEENQTETGYYEFNKISIQPYLVNNKNRLLYVTPREIAIDGRTYNNKTFEYTHGMGLIVTSATTASETGTLNYIQKEVDGSDNVIKISNQQIYYGLETNSNVVTKTKNKKEYDYTDAQGVEHTSEYNGQAGLSLGFIDRLVLGITKGDLNLAFSSEMTENSKILINRNVIARAKKVIPNLIYDENPYTVITDDGKIKWVLDAYTVSSNYPYSQYTSIQHDNIKENINYIRNSIKVIIDAYDGTIDFYVTDRTDPIAMAYRNTYTSSFKELDEAIPEDIAKHIVYPEYLYNIQANMLQVYHNVKPDVLYREDDLWTIAKSNTSTNTKSTGTIMSPYYTMVKTKEGKEEVGLIQIYTPAEKQNMISYLVGNTDGTTNTLKLYKYSQESSVVGPMQLDKQIAEDEEISKELEALSTTGTKVSKQMIVVPINNTLLYVEPVYQTMLNESEIPILKKVIVASGTKVAIGDNLTSALEQLLSQSAVNIEVENTEDIKGLIDAIIKANKNLSTSNENNDWEMMGKDVKKLQDLVTSLEKLKEEEEKKKAEQNNASGQKSQTTSTLVTTQELI